MAECGWIKTAHEEANKRKRDKWYLKILGDAIKTHKERCAICRENAEKGEKQDG